MLSRSQTNLERTNKTKNKKDKKTTKKTIKKNEKKSNVDIVDINFWSFRFIDHMHYILAILILYFNEKEAKKLKTIAYSLIERWKDAKKKKKKQTGTSLDDLIEDTLDYKLMIKKLLKKNLLLTVKKNSKTKKSNNIGSLDCWIDLLGHMIEELQEFDKLQLEEVNNTRKIKQGDDLEILVNIIIRWCTEHAEAEEFVTCQVPKLLNAPPPQKLKKAAKTNLEIANKFKELKQKINKLDVSKKNKTEVQNKKLQNLCDEFLFLSEKHIQNALTFSVNLLPTLPMEELLRTLVNHMVEHELKEAVWARKIILNI